MQINNENPNVTHQTPSFKKLQSVKFVGNIAYDNKSKIELLKILDLQPIKDIFTKFDGKAEFVSSGLCIDSMPEYFALREDKADLRIKGVSFYLELVNDGVSKLTKQFKKQAANAGIDFTRMISLNKAYKNCRIKLKEYGCGVAFEDYYKANIKKLDELNVILNQKNEEYRLTQEKYEKLANKEPQTPTTEKNLKP